LRVAGLGVIQADGTFKVPFLWNPRQRIMPN
jgi:hypothetical protein